MLSGIRTMMENGKVRINLTLDPVHNFYHKEVVEAFKSLHTDTAMTEFLVSAVLYYQKSPSYQLQSGLQSWHGEYRESIKEFSEHIAMQAKYIGLCKDEVQEVADHAIRSIRESDEALEDRYRMQREWAQEQFDRLANLVMQSEVVRSPAYVMSVPSEGDDGMDDAFDSLVETFG
jgi:hypothetical protein